MAPQLNPLYGPRRRLPPKPRVIRPGPGSTRPRIDRNAARLALLERLHPPVVPGTLIEILELDRLPVSDLAEPQCWIALVHIRVEMPKGRTFERWLGYSSPREGPDANSWESRWWSGDDPCAHEHKARADYRRALRELRRISRANHRN